MFLKALAILKYCFFLHNHAVSPSSRGICRGNEGDKNGNNYDDKKIVLLIVMDCDGSFVPEREMSKVKLTESVGASTYKATLVRPPS